jgi:serine/threonine protein kinase
MSAEDAFSSSKEPEDVPLPPPSSATHPASPDAVGEARKTDRPPTSNLVRWQAPAADALTNSFPGLRVAALAGVGGMGAVYRAEQSRLGRTVAVKILPPVAAPDDEARERFEREARILSGLNHPHILQIHDFGALADGTLYLVSEWASGGDLAKLLDGKPHPPAEVQVWVRQIAAALEAAHARGVIHRDLKPGNVLVHADGRLTLADFGLAHAGGGGFTTALTMPGAIFGTFEYMAPEQMEAAGRVTPASDIFALGVMTYQMLTGRVPRGAYTRPSRLVRVPSEVDTFLDLAMANDPARRPKNATEFSRLFDRACLAPARRRQRQLIGLGVTLVVLALAWARSEIIHSEREAAAAEARTAALVAEARLMDARRQAAAALAAAAEAAEVSRFEPVTVSPPSPPPEPAAPVVTPEPLPEPSPALNEPAVEPPKSEPVVQADVPAVPWTWVLPEVNPADHSFTGDWRMTRGELVSADGRCTLSLPVRLAINYDVAIEFTRNEGRHSVAVFLPTLAGVGTFEVDAWDLGIAGLQMIDGQDMRRTNRFFPARLDNGQKHRLIIEVRGNKVSVSWDGEPRMSWDLADRRLRIPPLWQVRPEIGLGVGTWSSPTTFHRIAYRSWPADKAP